MFIHGVLLRSSSRRRRRKMQDVDAGMQGADDRMQAAYDRMHAGCMRMQPACRLHASLGLTRRLSHSGLTDTSFAL